MTLPYTREQLLRAWQRMAKRVRIPNDRSLCWIWGGLVNAHGYGRIRFLKQHWLAHRLSWLIHRGAIPDLQGILHRCDTPACVNPDHLFPGTQSDNINDMCAKGRHFNQIERRTPTPGLKSAARTHCKRGHPYSGYNLRVRTDKAGRFRQRICRECRKIERRLERRRAAVRLVPK